MPNELMKEKLWEIEQLQARIAELEKQQLKCSCCHDPITDMDNDSNLCGACADELKAERDRLRKAAIVWHKYPEEKPEKTGYYIIYYTILNRVAFDFWHNDKQGWDKYGEYILAWAYLPIGKNYLKAQEEEDGDGRHKE